MVDQVKEVFKESLNSKEDDDAPIQINEVLGDSTSNETFYGASHCKAPHSRYADRGWNRHGQGYHGQRETQEYSLKDYRRSSGNRSDREENRRSGDRPRFYICGSIYNFARECPDKAKSKSIENKLQFYTEVIMETLVGETFTIAVLDSGRTKTVCSQNWLNYYVESLSDEDASSIKEEPSSTVFKLEMVKKSKHQMCHHTCLA
ncbi:uncharacterized protein LOC130636047 [Hydractinia symbiolongicarpus]|uniref:uncharacterized protein LOC130636047 n=1 Tax=Hydractinia symbiolongicarpus TaxID=13093 RepID=UPI0025514FDD|nr:uncharacterized protein LOC130636047 [Hydractinia symbiolongicarpus]